MAKKKSLTFEESEKRIKKTLEKDCREKALSEVKMYQSNDWDLVEETPEYFLMKRNRSTFGGHILVFLLTVWFTFGIGNVIYYFASIQKKKIVK